MRAFKIDLDQIQPYSTLQCCSCGLIARQGLCDCLPDSLWSTVLFLNCQECGAAHVFRWDAVSRTPPQNLVRRTPRFLEVSHELIQRRLARLNRHSVEEILSLQARKDAYEIERAQLTAKEWRRCGAKLRINLLPLDRKWAFLQVVDKYWLYFLLFLVFLPAAPCVLLFLLYEELPVIKAKRRKEERLESNSEESRAREFISDFETDIALFPDEWLTMTVNQFALPHPRKWLTKPPSRPSYLGNELDADRLPPPTPTTVSTLTCGSCGCVGTLCTHLSPCPHCKAKAFWFPKKET